MIKAFQVSKVEYSYECNSEEWNGPMNTIKPIVHLTISFMYRGKEYIDQKFSARKDGNDIRIVSTPSNWYRNAYCGKSYSEGMRTEICEAVFAYVSDISPTVIENEVRKVILERFEAVKAAKLNLIQELQGDIAILNENKSAFSSASMSDCKYVLSEKQFNHEVFR
jgi:hypothetical protein